MIDILTNLKKADEPRIRVLGSLRAKDLGPNRSPEGKPFSSTTCTRIGFPVSLIVHICETKADGTLSPILSVESQGLVELSSVAGNRNGEEVLNGDI